ncbi:MAG: YceI family protein [Pseudonocardiaceae bacterium]
MPWQAAGRWTPAGGQLRFCVKATWGLSTVNGRFSSFEGAPRVQDDGAAPGELTVQVASLSTKNKRRDEHLRSADFFDVERHPTIRFSANAVTSGTEHLTISA